MTPRVSRFAPTASGRAHPGTLLAGLLCWLDARRRGARLLLRLEDLDPERCSSAHADALIDDLAWFGLDWDACERQSQQGDGHAAALDALAAQGRLYPSPSSRRELAALGRIVADAPDGLELALDVTIDTGDDAGLAIHRARHVARLLDTAGQGEVAVGVRHGTAGAVALELRLAGRMPLRPSAARPAGTGVP